MPTGYTEKLMREGQTFQEFVLTCARAFGALIDMRDNPSDAPIPDKIEPSKYYTDKIKEASDKFEILYRMKDAEKEAYGQQQKDAILKTLNNNLVINEMENERLQGMRLLVQSWIPPTQKHIQLKEFMLRQIDISINKTDYYYKLIEEYEKLTPASFYIKNLSECKRSIDSYKKENKKEIKMAQSKTKWIQKLKKSIGL